MSDGIDASTAPSSKPVSPAHPTAPPRELPQEPAVPSQAVAQHNHNAVVPNAVIPQALASPADTDDAQSVCTDQLEDLCREFRMQVREMIVQRSSGDLNGTSNQTNSAKPLAGGASERRVVSESAAVDAGEWAAVEAAVADIAT